MFTTSHNVGETISPLQHNNLGTVTQTSPPDKSDKPTNVGAQGEVPSAADLKPALPEQWELPDLRIPKMWSDLGKRLFTDKERTEAWAKVSDAVRSYSDETVKRWNDEIDSLLVYAGLFSAILTAFNVQSYSLLTPPSRDPVLDTLERISAQLSSFTVNQQFVNSTLPGVASSATPPSPPPRAPKWAVWLNVLWFSSLIFSLFAASVSILLKQWLIEYSSGLSDASRRTARLRQHRLNNLIKCRLETIITSLPLLLQAASVLFFAGLLILLWQLDRTVAIVATSLIGVLYFTIATAILPSIVFDRSYLNSVSKGVSRSMRAVSKRVPALRVALTALSTVAQATSRWLSLNIFAQLGLSNTPTRWLDAFPSQAVIGFVSGARRAWSTREWKLLEGMHDDLDTATVITAYTTTMDVSMLSVASPCILDLSPLNALRCFVQIDEEDTRHRLHQGKSPLLIFANRR